MRKKDKRALAEAKHEREMEEIRQSGLKAQERDRQQRAHRRERSGILAKEETEALAEILAKANND